MKNPLKKLRFWTPIQWFAAAFTVGMFVSDTYTFLDFFTSIVYPPDNFVYAVVMAAALEGLPFYLGTISSEKVDVGGYYKNDKEVTRRGKRIVWAAILFTFVLAVGLRVSWLVKMYFEGDLRNPKDYENAIPHLFLAVLPIITSVLSYVASWFAFRSSYVERLYKEVIRKQDIYLKCKEQFQDAYDTLQRAKYSLWNSLVEADGPQMPRKNADFRKECFAHIRSKLIANCITCYPTQIERYTQEVNLELEKCILEMSKHTPLPQSITKITLAEVIEDHDANAMDYADCWNYNLAGPDLEAELRSTLDNAVVVAQFETVIRQNNKRNNQKRW